MRISDWSSDVCSSDLGDDDDLAGKIDSHQRASFAGRSLHSDRISSRGSPLVSGSLRATTTNWIARNTAQPRNIAETPNVSRTIGQAWLMTISVSHTATVAIPIARPDRKSTPLNSSHYS